MQVIYLFSLKVVGLEKNTAMKKNNSFLIGVRFGFITVARRRYCTARCHVQKYKSMLGPYKTFSINT
jgi:hypothetical protein